jgi:hypothetical protein
LILSRPWVCLIQEPRKCHGAHQGQRVCGHQTGFVCRVVWQNGGVLIRPDLHIAEPTVVLCVGYACKLQANVRLTHKLLDLGPPCSSDHMFSAPHTARIVEYGAITYKFRCTSLDSIAERSMEHIASTLRLRYAVIFPSGLVSVDYTLDFFDRVLASGRASVLWFQHAFSRFIMLGNVCALYTTLQSIVSILPRRASWLPGLAT